jgi:hypothetical protein
MPNSKAESPPPFEVVKITFTDGRTQYGFWNHSRWSSQGKLLETEDVVKWERKELEPKQP